MAKVSGGWLMAVAVAGGVIAATDRNPPLVPDAGETFSAAAAVTDRPPAVPVVAPVTVRVVDITDGDSLVVLDPGNFQIRVRLANIDAPEPGQPWGRRSARVLRDLAAGQTVEMVETDRDQYGRVVADLYVSGRYINQELVELGAAWA